MCFHAQNCCELLNELSLISNVDLADGIKWRRLLKLVKHIYYVNAETEKVHLLHEISKINIDMFYFINRCCV